MTTSKRLTAILILCLLGCFLGQTLFCETLAEPPSNFHDPDVGTRENPFLISNLANLRWLSETPEVWRQIVHWDPVTGYPIYEYRYFLQTADIDATETINWNSGRGFDCIQYFNNRYNGDFFKISNIYINDPSKKNLGFFGSAFNAILENILIEDIVIIATGGSPQNVGGLIGESGNYTQIVRASTTGNISLLNDVEGRRATIGGLVGFSEDATWIWYSYSSIDIYADFGGSSTIGGLIGASDGPPNPALVDTYFNGSIICERQNSYIGGLIGSGFGPNLFSSYVTSSKPFSHGAGIAASMGIGILEKLFWDIEATGTVIGIESGNSGYEDDIKGLTTLEMKDYDTYKDAGWDFVDIWSIDPEINNGYPYLRTNPPHPVVVSNNDNPIKPLVNSIVYPNPVRDGDVTIKWFTPPSPPHSEIASGGFQGRDLAMTIRGAELVIYNVRGQLVKRSSDFETRDGENVFVWDRRNEMGQEVASGVYFYRIHHFTSTVSPSLRSSSHGYPHEAIMDRRGIVGRFIILK